jgi:hypothetical protein
MQLSKESGIALAQAPTRFFEKTRKNVQNTNIKMYHILSQKSISNGNGEFPLLSERKTDNRGYQNHQIIFEYLQQGIGAPLCLFNL